MKDELQKLYESEGFINATNEEKVEMTTKALGPLAMPKDVYNELNEKYKSSEQRLQTISNDFEEYKKARMTDEEKAQAEREAFLNQKLQLEIKTNELEVIRKLEKAGLTEEQYEGQLDLIVSEDKDKSLRLADFLVNTLKTNSEKVKQETQVELLNDTPKPIVGSANVVTNNLDEYKAMLQKAIDEKDVLKQATYTRMIQEEKSKQTI